MSNRNIKLIVFLGAFAIIGILSAQIYWIWRTYDLQERQFQHSVEVALIRVAESLEIYNESSLPTKNLINKRASNYYVVNVNDVIDANILEYFLQREFAKSAINTDFEYGIYDCSSDKMVYGNYMSSGDKLIDKPTTELPKYDEFTYYFGVRFPNLTARIISTMRLVIIFTVILLVAISFFVYALSVILKQKRLSEMQKDFINNMTHEFKTPLSTIAISADVFLKNAQVSGNDRLISYARLIKDQTSRLTDQVEKVLQIVKVENDSFSLNKEIIDINLLLKEICQSYELKFEEKKGMVRIDLPDCKVMTMADPMHTANILENLIDNAIKYADVNPLLLNVKGECIDEKFLIEIKDNGKGIPPEYHHRVFDKFFRVPTGNVHDVKGFGLGLFYVRNICKQQNWIIQMNSELDKGTKFTITVPKVDLKHSNS